MSEKNNNKVAKKDKAWDNYLSLDFQALYKICFLFLLLNFSINLISLPLIKCQKKTNEEWLWWKIIPFCKRLDKIKLHDALHLFFLLSHFNHLFYFLRFCVVFIHIQNIDLKLTWKSFDKVKIWCIMILNKNTCKSSCQYKWHLTK